MDKADRTWAHLNAQGHPHMVDISHKSVSLRTATARARVQLPPALRSYVVGQDIHLKKGPVFQTATIAGTMAVKRTDQLIPFCHQIPVEDCTFDITIDDHLLVTIHCTVKTSAKTGVEMEALCGAATAALTIYDMCKSVSPHICIQETRLVTKSGGKNALLERPLYGLVLTGGRSKRMGRDKALLNPFGKPHAAYLYRTAAALLPAGLLVSACRSVVGHSSRALAHTTRSSRKRWPDQWPIDCLEYSS
jgi:cyclic pyranopterin phosphate synthase